jgi:threonine dehydrogenase-like Zn-dependent dehydrogenase
VTGEARAKEFALQRDAAGAYGLLELPAPPAPGHGQVLLRPELVGICGSDLGAHCEGRNRGCGFGHEWVGEIVALGPGVSGFALGERATSGAFVGCGACAACRDGRANHCASPTVLGAGALGAARSWLVLPAAELVRVPEFMGDAGVLLEPASVGVEVLRSLGQQSARDPDVLVVGAGPIGLLSLLLLREAGARVTAIDRCDERLDAARELGASAIHAGDEARLLALERTFPTVVDCAHGRDGSRGGLDLAPRLARRGARVVVVAKYPAGTRVEVDRYAGLDVRFLRGVSRDALAETAARFAKCLHEHQRALLRDEFPVASIEPAIAHALEPRKSRKVVLRVS